MAWSLSGPTRCCDGRDVPELVAEAAARAKTAVAVQCEADAVPDAADLDAEDSAAAWKRAGEKGQEMSTDCRTS